jgi:adenylyltransferase/sulfurtransferase
MTPIQKLRYYRQIILPNIGEAGQQRLLQARVLIIGLGGLGSPASMYLAAAGVGTLVLSDFDCVEVSNLQRQIVHSYANIGESKVLSAKQTITNLNPDCSVIAKDWELEPQDLIEEIGLADIVLDCSDNFFTRFTLNKACIAQETPLISGAATRYTGQIMTIIPKRGGCYECLYPAVITEEYTLGCEQGIISPLVGVIGSLQALQAMQYLINHNFVNAGQLLIFEATTMQWSSHVVPRDTKCMACGVEFPA